MAAILQGYAIVGLIIVCQRPAFGADNVILRLQLARSLVEHSSVSAGQSRVVPPRQFDGASDVSLRMTDWIVVLEPSELEEEFKLQFTHSLAEYSYINVSAGRSEPALRLQLLHRLDDDLQGIAQRSQKGWLNVDSMSLRSSGWMGAQNPPEVWLNLQLAHRLTDDAYVYASTERLGAELPQRVGGDSLTMSGWMAALKQPEAGVRLQLTRGLDEDSYVNVNVGAGLGLRLQLARSLAENSYTGQSGVGLPWQVGGGSLRMSGWMEVLEQSGANDDDLPEISKAVLLESQRYSGKKAKTSSQLAQSEKNSLSDRIAGTLGMGLAPIRWGGYTSDTFRATKSSESPIGTDHSQRLDLRASSYIWQPWFSTVSGGIGMSRGVFDSGDNNTGEVKSDSLTGFGDLALFPQSRFPFSAAFSVSDSSTSSSLTADDQTSTRYSLRQTYRPETGNSNYSASYQNSTLTSKSSGDDVVESLQGSYSNSIGNQRFGLDADHTETSRSQKSEGLLLNTFSARHSYSPGVNLSVESNARMSDSTLRMRNTTFDSASAARYLQASSFATWRPKESLPLNVNAGISLFSAQSEFSGASSESRSVNGNIGMTYNPTRNLSLGANGGVTVVSAGVGGTSIITTENANVNYSGDPVIFNKFNYNWNVSGSVGNMTSDMGSTQTLSAGASHGLNREYRINENSALNFGANQSLSSNWSGGEAGQYANLNHTGSISWQVTPSDSMTGSLNLSATDTRTIGDQESENQFVSLQGNGHVQLSTYSSATANIGVQWNRQGKSAGNEDDPVRTALYTNGSASYQHSRAFGINNLRYSLLASMNMQQTNARLLGDGNADASPLGYSLEQHFNYNIGRIDMGLVGTISVQNDRENALLFFRIGRSFGNY